MALSIFLEVFHACREAIVWRSRANYYRVEQAFQLFIALFIYLYRFYIKKVGSC